MFLVQSKDGTKIGGEMQYYLVYVILVINKVSEKFGFWVLGWMGYFLSNH